MRKIKRVGKLSTRQFKAECQRRDLPLRIGMIYFGIPLRTGQKRKKERP